MAMLYALTAHVKVLNLNVFKLLTALMKDLNNVLELHRCVQSPLINALFLCLKLAELFKLYVAMVNVQPSV